MIFDQRSLGRVLLTDETAEDRSRSFGRVGVAVPLFPRYHA
jgi:hypothetical protein